MLPFRLLILWMFFGLSSSLFAQKNKSREDSTVVVIFNQNKSDDEGNRKKHAGESNIVKISPLGFITGIFPIYYERRINDFFTIQVGAGITHKNYLRSAIMQADEFSNLTYPWVNDGSKIDQSEALFNFKYRKVSPGFMFSIQPRLYFDSEAPDGSFLGLSYDYSRYNFNIPGISGQSPLTNEYVHNGSTQNEHENISDLMVYWGYQSVYDRLTLEYTTGIGLRNVTGNKYVYGTDYSGGSIVEGFATYKQSTFNFNLGIKVGYHF